MPMAPPRDGVARVPALIVHGGAGADPAEGRDELRGGVRAAVLAGCYAAARYASLIRGVVAGLLAVAVVVGTVVVVGRADLAATYAVPLLLAVLVGVVVAARPLADHATGGGGRRHRAVAVECHRADGAATVGHVGRQPPAPRSWA